MLKATVNCLKKISPYHQFQNGMEDIDSHFELLSSIGKWGSKSYYNKTLLLQRQSSLYPLQFHQQELNISLNHFKLIIPSTR